MPKPFIAELWSRLESLPASVETHGRSILLGGFFLLLLLIFFIGYRGRQSIEQLDDDIAVLHQKEAQHLGLVLKIAEVAGEMASEARNAHAPKDASNVLHFAATPRLKLLKT